MEVNTSVLSISLSKGWGISHYLKDQPNMKDIKVKIVKNDKDFQKAMAVRYKGYKSFYLSEHEVSDDYDFLKNATLLLAIDSKNNALGSMRVLDSRYGPIELSQFLNISSLMNGYNEPYAEATRFSVPIKTNGALMAKLLLCKAYYQYCLENHIETMLFWARPLIGRLYQFMCADDVGEIGVFYNEHFNNKLYKTYRLRVSDLEIRMKAINHPLYHLFTSRCSNISLS